MEKNDLKALGTSIITTLIAVGLAFAVSWKGDVVFGVIPVYAIAVTIAFLIQWIVFIPSFIYKTEKYYDLTGSVTYTTVIIISILLSRNFNLRTLLILGLVLIWAFRLGIFLFRRILKAGEDKRFKELKKSGFQFFRAWTLQGLWVSFTLAAALATITGDNKSTTSFLWYDWTALAVGLLVWLIGFGFEATADRQKKIFIGNPENRGKFINVGLWSISRHPNYFGEITLWVGIAIISLPTLVEWRFFALISPIFVFLLITQVSGLPILEKFADDTWGGQQEYEKYKKNTPVLFPKLWNKK